MAEITNIAEFPKIETVNLRKEILSVGKFNGTYGTTEISNDDITEYIENFKNLRGVRDVPLRIGHTSQDKPTSKIFRAGTVDSLERGISKKTGKPTLVANIRNVPIQIFDYISKEILKPVSIEAQSWTDGITGKKYRNVLTAIALMGSANPAVPALADFEISFAEHSDEEKIIIEYTEEEIKMENTNEVLELQEKAKNLATELAEKSTELTEKENERLKVIEEKKELENKLTKFREDVEKKSIDEFIEANPTKILPAEKERVIRIFKNLDNNVISFEDGETKLNLRQEFQEFIKNLKDQISFETTSKNIEVEKKIEFKDINEKRDYIGNEARKLAKEAGISLTEATDKLVAEYK